MMMTAYLGHAHDKVLLSGKGKAGWQTVTDQEMADVIAMNGLQGWSMGICMLSTVLYGWWEPISEVMQCSSTSQWSWVMLPSPCASAKPNQITWRQAKATEERDMQHVWNGSRHVVC